MTSHHRVRPSAASSAPSLRPASALRLTLAAALTAALGLGAVAPATAQTSVQEPVQKSAQIPSGQGEASFVPEVVEAAASAGDPTWEELVEDDRWPAPVVSVKVTGRKAVVTWEPVGDESHLLGYLVDQEEGDDYYEVVVGAERSVEFDLVGGTTNHFVVIPVTVAEELATPGRAEVKAPVFTPERPGSVGVWNNFRTFTVSWSAPERDGGAPVTHYVVKIGGLERRVNAGSNLQLDVTAGVHIPHNSLLPVTVTAVNSDGASETATATIVTDKVLLPSAPRAFKVSSALKNEQVHHAFTWDVPEVKGDLGVERWELRIGSRVIDLPGHVRSYDDEYAQGGVAVRATLRAVNPDGLGAAASLSTSTPKVKPSKPRKVGAMSGFTRGPSVRVDWRHPSSLGTSSEMRYEVKVQRVKGKKGVGKVITKRTTRVNQDILTVKVPRKATYRVKVRTRTAHGTSGWTGWKRVVVD